MRIGILGAGAIGTYIGGRLALAGHDVTLISRSEHALSRGPLTLSDLAGYRAELSASRGGIAGQGPIRAARTVDALRGVEVLVVSVKSDASETAARAAAAFVPQGVPWVSFQNGLRNPEAIQRGAPEARVVRGMVPFNVAASADGTYHQATSGALCIEMARPPSGRGRTLAAPEEQALGRFVAALTEAGLAVRTYPDLRDVAFGKLTFNLNNPLNALSGLPLREQLLDRGYRCLLADAMSEALRVGRVWGLRARGSGGLIPSLAPPILRLPTPLFVRVAARMVRIDGRARSSMADDLAAHRPTEIDHLSGEVWRMAEAKAMSAPINRAIWALVKAAEAHDGDPPRMTADEIRAYVKHADERPPLRGAKAD